MNKKEVIIDLRAKKEYKRLPTIVQRKFHNYFEVLKYKGRLEEPEGKKFNKNLYEVRVKVNGAYRLKDYI